MKVSITLLFTPTRNHITTIYDYSLLVSSHQNPIPLPLNADLPGMGQYYCLSCARFFINKDTLAEHTKTQLHKKLYVNSRMFPDANHSRILIDRL